MTDPIQTIIFSGAVNITGSGQIVECLLSQPVTVSNSRDRVFAVYLVVTGASTGSSVTTYVLGDQFIPQFSGRDNFPGTLAEIQANPFNHFIWSDGSDYSGAGSDYTNGYGVFDFSARSTATVLSM